MQFSKVLAVATLAVSASAYSNSTVYTTEVVTEYTTVCPAATTLTYNGVTITATESETITLPCPCTVVKPITTSSVVACNTCAAATTAVPAYVNSTIPAVPTTAAATTTKAAVGTTSATTAAASTSATAFTGGANKFAASGASLAGLVGLAAYLL